MNTENAIHPVKYLADYQPLPWITDNVELDFEILDPEVRVINRMTLHRRDPNLPYIPPLTLNGESLKLLEIRVNNIPYPETHWGKTENLLTLHHLPSPCTVEIITQFDPHQNLALEGLYADGEMLVTQNEAEGFRRITYFADRPDNMARYKVKITADAGRYPVLLSNGNLQESGNLPDGRHFVIWDDPFPKPCYLFALVAGNLACRKDNFTTQSGRIIDLRIYVPETLLERTAWAMACLKKAMRWDEERFGLECDLNTYMIVSTDTFNAGAMENKGLNIFNSACILADRESATDSDFQAVDRVIAHEYFHNYTGNRITCRDWFQLTLKEGLTVFRDSEYTADTLGKISRIADVRNLRETQFAEDAGPLSHPIRPESYTEINNFYTATVYKKGAEVIRMIQTLAGREKFRLGIDEYFRRYDGQAVTTENFIDAMSAGTGHDLTRFQNWYTQAGTPELTVVEEFNSKNGQLRIHITQTNPKIIHPLYIPILYALLNPVTGSPLNLKPEESGSGNENLLEMRSQTQTWTFQTPCHEKPLISLLRDFSAPVTLRRKTSDAELAFLMIHDTDTFSQYEASQELMQRILLHLYETPNGIIPESLKTGWQTFLTQYKPQDALFLALSLTPPTLSKLTQELKSYDPTHLYHTREKLISHLSEYAKHLLCELYKKVKVCEPYTPSPEQSGRRALFGTALSLYCHADPEGYNIACELFRTADNMTDKMTAFKILTLRENPFRQSVIDTFRERWKNDTLVMNKWFSAQAESQTADLISQIQKLESDPCFDSHNPNKISALYGTFVRNLPQYHLPDGSGYRFIAEKIRHIDTFNPQVSASLARTAFSAYPKLPESLKIEMTNAAAILLSGTQSRHLNEVLTRIFHHGAAHA